MIFDRHVAWNILEGKTTQFRRPAAKDSTPGWKEGQRHQVQVERQEDGELVRHTLGHIRIIEIYSQHLSEITDAEAQANGYPTREHFFTRWREKHSTGPLDPDAHCWTVRFELARDHIPRLLHQDSSHGYTADTRLALPDEPEAVPAADQERITADAGRVYDVTHADDRRRQEARGIGSSVKEALNRARIAGVDIDENVARLRAELDEIRRKLSDAA